MASQRPAPPIDLRSDTVTRPTDAMRAAIAAAPLGDDVYGEDPTVNRLQTIAAELAGKEAALLVPSGTMGNLVSLLAHCPRGAEVILGDESHIFHYEAGGASVLGGLVYHVVQTSSDGSLELEGVRRAIRPSDGNAHFAPAGVVCLENTHNRMGGTVIAPAHAADIASVAAEHGLPVHLDGARIFNAAVALDVSIREWTDQATSVQFCLSKGLAAPIGSIVAGPRLFVERAWRLRKMLGGGMRQAGVVAAAGLVALETMVARLAEDHRRARTFAEGLAAFPDLRLDLARVQTNIVVFESPAEWDPAAFIAAAREQGVLLTPFGGRRIRAMTHCDVSDSDCDRALGVLSVLIQSRLGT